MKPDRVVLDHGSGGRASQALIRDIFLAHLGNPELDRLEDAAVVEFGPGRLALTTDGYVVDPIFFPGGDIGALAVHGTVNDLAMRGARPLYLTASFILEEGLPLADLAKIAASMGRAAAQAGVIVAAGDTKVVGRGSADKVFIATAGAGLVPEGRDISLSKARPGDAVLVSGGLGEHGVAVLAGRQGLNLETPVISDSAPLNGLVEAMIDAAGHGLHCLRDATRGGLASVVNELAQASAVGVDLDEAALPLAPAVTAACEILGLDPLYLANEGKLMAVVAPEAAEAALAAMRRHDLGLRAALIGRVTVENPGRVTMRTVIGGRRVVDLLLGEQLPRIC